MRILLLGKIGQLGWELNRTLAPLGEITALDYPDIDLTKSDIQHTIQDHQPQIVINATAYTAVDRAEEEPQLAEAINGRAPGLMAEATKAIGAGLIHYSTDYVFDGKKGQPYIETDATDPLGVYGRSKLVGEEAIQAVGGAYLILRTSWVYSMRRDNFVRKALQWARQHRVMRVVTDQVSNPTWARMLAETTAQLLARTGENPAHWIEERHGVYHLAGSGYASRMEWVQEILHLDPKPGEQVVQEIQPALTSDFPTPAERPLYSALNCDRFRQIFDLSLPDWKTALSLAMAE
jgi:dTDP-4-dehydrorhamnose reductase